MMRKSFGFTLGEVLIALTVIGVVASLTIPQLIKGQKAGQARAQFNTAYSILAKSLAEMDADNVSVDPASYKTSQSLYKALKNYHKVIVDCGDYSNANKNASVCIGQGAATANDSLDNYYIFNKTSNTKIYMNRLDDGAFVINNGMMFAFENPENGYIWVSIDINGKNKLPNRWGWDLFTFELTKNGFLPLGAPGTTADYSNSAGDITSDKYCSPTETGNENGSTCAYYASTDDEYFNKLYKGY